MFRKLCIALILLSGSAQAQSSLSLSLEEAVEHALKNNEDILIAENSVRAAKASVREARADALPNITLSGQYLRNIKRPVFFFPSFSDPNVQVAIRIGSLNAYSAALSLSQPLFRAGKVGKALKVAKLFTRFSEEGQRSTRADVILAVHEAYYQVLLAGRLLEVNRQNEAQTLRHLERTRKLFAQGQVSEFDTLRAWVSSINIRPTVIAAENALEITRNTLKNLIGVPYDVALELRDSLSFRPRPLPTLEEAIRLAEAQRPELRQLELEVRMRRLNIGIIRADILPSLNLIGTWQSQAQSDRSDFGDQGFVKSLSAGLQLTIPIFDGMRTYARMDKARAEHRTAVYTLQKIKEEIHVQVKSLLYSVEEARKTIEAQQGNIDQARRALELAELRYREGQATLLDLDDSRLALNQAQTNYYQAVYNYLIARINLDRALGVL